MRETRAIRLSTPPTEIYKELSRLGWRVTPRMSWFINGQCFAEMEAPAPEPYQGSDL